MTQQPQTQTETDVSDKNEQAYVTAPKKTEIPGRTPDASYTEPRTNPNPKMGATQPNTTLPTPNPSMAQPGMTQAQPNTTAMRQDNPTANGTTPELENAAADAPTGRTTTQTQADSKTDASPNQNPPRLKADQPRDK
jgi:hypothetical protein